MKEVIAVIQMNKMESTKNALDATGFPAFVAYKVMGRGKQKGLQIPYPPDFNQDDMTEGKVHFLPKRMISIVVEDEYVPAVVAVIKRINRTGNIGDGKIFVCPIDDVIRIRTRERGNMAL